MAFIVRTYVLDSDDSLHLLAHNRYLALLQGAHLIPRWRNRTMRVAHVIVEIDRSAVVSGAGEHFVMVPFDARGRPCSDPCYLELLSELRASASIPPAPRSKDDESIVRWKPRIELLRTLIADVLNSFPRWHPAPSRGRVTEGTPDYEVHRKPSRNCLAPPAVRHGRLG